MLKLGRQLDQFTKKQNLYRGLSTHIATKS
jgi:hypothetical protein